MIEKGSIIDSDAGAIVNPANSRGVMGGGVARTIKEACGADVERQAMLRAPISVGDAVITGGGESRIRT